MADDTTPRVFKTAWFAKAARKADIRDAELCEDIQEIMKGQCADMAGGVLKKRQGKNLFRSIVLHHSGRYWIYVFLFAKNDRPNINNKELIGFQKLATRYSKATETTMNTAVKDKELMEICHETKV